MSEDTKDFQDINKAVSKGLGIAMSSGRATEGEGAKGELLKFSFPNGRMVRQLYMVKNKNQRNSTAAYRLIHLVQEEYIQGKVEGEEE